MHDQVEEFIDFIVSLVNDEFDYKLDYIDARYYFTHGGCLIFSQVLKYYLPEAKIVINKSLDHIALFYHNNYYDATGKIENDKFQEVSSEYLDAYQNQYGRPEVELSKNFTSKVLIQELNACSGNPISGLLKNIQNKMK